MKVPVFHSRSSGFTLLELLVVISIIGILIAMGTAAFSTAQQQSRDARRRSDIRAMHNAFEQYYSLNGSYNASCATMAAGSLPQGLPTDPQSGSAYTCLADSDSYCVCATLENTTGGNAGAGSTADSCAFGAGGFFCIESLQ